MKNTTLKKGYGDVTADTTNALTTRTEEHTNNKVEIKIPNASGGYAPWQMQALLIVPTLQTTCTPRV